MTAPLSSTPWTTQALWQEANASLAFALSRNQAAMDAACRCAGEIRHLLERAFPIMADLCQQTCPTCTDICCRRAWVWIDFRDLLFLHLADIPRPKAQLLRSQVDRCRYAGPHGCRLERIQRPFVCTWYVCPEQSRRLTTLAHGKQHLSSLLNRIKEHRSRMEDAFIRAVA